VALPATRIRFTCRIFWTASGAGKKRTARSTWDSGFRSPAGCRHRSPGAGSARMIANLALATLMVGLTVVIHFVGLLALIWVAGRLGPARDIPADAQRGPVILLLCLIYLQIIAGAFVMASASLVLLALGSGLGLAMISPWPGSGASAATFSIPSDRSTPTSPAA